MSDISRELSADERAAMAEVAPSWQPSATLSVLDDLVLSSALVPHAVARRGGLSTTELHALRFLSESPRGPVELAHLLGVTSAAASGIVDRLAVRGHIERRPHPEDGRRTQVVITESGRREAFAMMAPMFRALAEVDGNLDAAERVVVERYLRGALAALNSLL